MALDRYKNIQKQVTISILVRRLLSLSYHLVNSSLHSKHSFINLIIVVILGNTNKSKSHALIS